MTPTELTNPLRAFKPGQDLETFTVNAIKTNLLSFGCAAAPTNLQNVYICAEAN